MVLAMTELKENLVALRDERERCVEVLSEAFATDLLDVDEFERRVDLAHQADTVNALVVLRNDLEGLQTTEHAANESSALVPVADIQSQQALTLAQAPTKWCVGLIGAVERKGRWRVPKKLRVTTVIGGALLDFREAIFAPGVSFVHVLACIGGIEILVPPSLAVECDGIGVMGGFESMERCPVVPDPSQPLLRISGLTFMGGVEIITCLAGETAGDARRRHKRERRTQEKQLTSGDGK